MPRFLDLLDNSGIQEFLAQVFRARGRTDRFEDLVRIARASPGKLSYASAGVGSIGHLSGVLIDQSAGTPIIASASCRCWAGRRRRAARTPAGRARRWS